MNTANTNNSNSNACRENTNAPVANSSIDINKTINTDTLQFPYHAGEDAEMEQRYTSRSWDFDAEE